MPQTPIAAAIPTAPVARPSAPRDISGPSNNETVSSEEIWEAFVVFGFSVDARGFLIDRLFLEEAPARRGGGCLDCRCAAGMLVASAPTSALDDPALACQLIPLRLRPGGAVARSELFRDKARFCRQRSTAGTVSAIVVTVSYLRFLEYRHE